MFSFFQVKNSNDNGGLSCNQDEIPYNIMRFEKKTREIVRDEEINFAQSI